MSETARRTSKRRKIGGQSISNARKARPAGPSPHLGSIFVQKRQRRRMARPEGPSRCFGYGSFVEERGSSSEASEAEPTSPFRGVWSKTPNSSPRRLAIWCFQGNQYVILLSTVLCREIALQQTILPPSRALMRSAIARKSLKMTDFSKTGSRNMAGTRAINFLTPVSYSISIVIGGLRRLLLPILMWAGVDLEYFRAETTWCSFRVFFPTLIAHGSKTKRARVLIFGTVGEYQTLYSN